MIDTLSTRVSAEQIRPLSDYVVIRADKPEEKYGSIFIPYPEVDGAAWMGTVVAAGPGDRPRIAKELCPNPVKVGDRVLYTRSSSNRWVEEGHEVEVSHAEQFVIAVIED